MAVCYVLYGWDNILEHICYAGIRLYNIFVFHNGQHGRLGKHSAIKSGCGKTGNTTSLTLTNRHSHACVSFGRKVKKLSIIGTRNVKEGMVGVVKSGEKIQNNLTCQTFRQGDMGACS